MAFRNYLLACFLPLLLNLIAQVFASDFMYPFNCSDTFDSCNALLYLINNGLQQEEVAAFYDVNGTQISPILRGDHEDYPVSVPASCKNTNGTTAYFYDATYTVKENDTFVAVSEQIYSGQAWEVEYEQGTFITGTVVPMHLLSGCIASDNCFLELLGWGPVKHEQKVR